MLIKLSWLSNWHIRSALAASREASPNKTDLYTGDLSLPLKVILFEGKRDSEIENIERRLYSSAIGVGSRPPDLWIAKVFKLY